jgi:type III secretion protein J
LDENDSISLRADLHAVGIESERERQADGTWTVLVESDEVVKALSYLSNARLLNRRRAVPKESSIVSSREEQLFRFERSLSAEIENTLLSISGMLDARVHLNLPKTDPLFGRKINQESSGTASVLAVCDSELEVDKSHIQSLVAGAAGLKSDQVSVLFHQVSLANTQVNTEALSHIAKSGQNLQISHSSLLILASFLLLCGLFFLMVFVKRSRGRRSDVEKISLEALS